MSILVSKDSSQNADSKIVTYLCDKMHQKKSYLRKRKILGLTFHCAEENRFFKITFLGALCHQGKFTFL
jgi:hypothetical protein